MSPHFLRKTLGVLSALLLLAPVAAQTVYKSTRPDGSVTYSDAPLPGAAKVERYEMVPMNAEDVARAAQHRAQDSRDLEAVTERQRQRHLALDRADAALKSAVDALKLAQQRLQDGVEPLPGERTGIIGGGRHGVRLNEDYYDRIRGLQQAVGDATQQLDQAYERRNELRE
jgi:hypothetical protein